MSQQKAQDKLVRYVRSRYEMIDVKSVQGLFNYRCFYNAVQYATDNEGVEVAEVITVSSDGPILHYINILNGEYLETTLGYLAEHTEYYFIRKIHPDDYKCIGNEFDRTLTSWTEQFTSWWDRVVLRVGRIL